MKLLKLIFIGLIICLSAISCDKDGSVEITGTILKTGITTYQYGSHTIQGYALTSNSVILDDYINQNVTVIGHRIDGYPIEDGPEYIEVEEIK